MGVISDIIAVTELFKDNKINTKELYRRMIEKNSVSKMANDAILQFPVLISNTLSLDTVTTINKALERQYSSFVLVATDLISVQKSGRDATAFLRFIHQNTNPGYVSNYTTTQVASSIAQKMNEDMQLCEDMKDFTYKSLGLKRESANEASKMTRMNILKEAKNNSSRNMSNAKRQEIEYQGQVSNFYRTREMDYKSQLDKEARIADANNRLKLDQAKSDRDKADRVEYENLNKISKQDFTVKLKDNDAKKANELVPTLMEVTLQFKDPDSDAIIRQTFTIGVKTVCHPVPSEDMIYNVNQTFANKKIFLKFIKWTTGEIKFFKDFLFNIDTIKKNVMQERKQIPWWSALKNRALYNRTIANLFKESKLLPNATLVMTTDEYEIIKSNTGIDMMKDIPRTNKLMSDLNLLGIVVVNESSEIAHFRFDGDNKWHYLGFNALEKENRNPSNDLKALVSLLR